MKEIRDSLVRQNRINEIKKLMQKIEEKKALTELIKQAQELDMGY
jgi:hypothetical protein